MSKRTAIGRNLCTLAPKGWTAAAAALMLVACSADTALVLRIIAKPGVHDGAGASPSDLQLTFQSSSDAVKREEVLTPTGGQRFFPTENATTVSIIANGRFGPSTVGAKARAVDRRVLGEGHVTAVLQDGATVEAPLTLFPTDFVANAKVAGGSNFSWGPGARQIASDGAGNFAIVWRTGSCTPYLATSTGTCEIFGRLFDKAAVPRLSAQGSTEEAVLSPGRDTYGSPAVAMQTDGRFAVAWMRKDIGPTTGIFVKAFTAAGQPDTNQGSPEAALSSGGAKFHAYPDIAATPNGYIVTWLERSDTDYTVMGRLLTQSGAPEANTLTIHTATKPNWITPANANEDWLSSLSQSVAADQQGGFFSVFHHLCDSTTDGCWAIRGRMYDGAGQPQGSVLELESTAANQTGMDVVTLPYGYMVAWSRWSAGATGSDIMARRFNFNAAPLETEWTVNTSLADHQFSVALGALADGSVLATWFTKDGTQHAGGGVRGRIMLSNGLPVGGDFALTTTEAALQASPAVTAVGPRAFAVTFYDDSRTPPDTQDSAIRARLVYPNYDPRDGQVGSRCSANECAPGLLCAPLEIPNRPNEQRCINQCTEDGAVCPNGGKCVQVQGAPAPVCLYPIR